ncbi:hypothetical protein [Parasphingorhabdus pacifica]
MNDQRRDPFGNSSQKQEERPAAPRPVQLARVLWLAGVVVGFVRSYVQLSDRERLIDRLSEAAPEMSQVQIDAAANSGIAVTLLISVLSLLVFALLCQRMVQGRNWARVVLTVFGGLNLVGTVFTLAAVLALGPQAVSNLAGVQVGVWELVFGVAILGIDAAAIVMMYQPESNRFFREMRSRRAGPRAAGG